KLVKRHDELRLGQHAAGQADQLDAVGQEMMEVDDIRPDLLEKLGVALDEQRVRCTVPPMVVVARQKQEFVRPLVKTGDARAAFVERRIGRVDRGQQNRPVLRIIAQPLEQLVADLLRPAAHKLGVKQADQQYGSL